MKQSPKHEVADMKAKMAFALDVSDNNLEKFCEFIPFMLEADEGL